MGWLAAPTLRLAMPYFHACTLILCYPYSLRAVWGTKIMRMETSATDTEIVIKTTSLTVFVADLISRNASQHSLPSTATCTYIYS